jgi:hypothetical protein
MKNIRFHVVVAAVLSRKGLRLFAVTSCFLLLRATCNAEDPKSAVGVDLRQNKAVNNRALHVHRSAVPITKSPPKNLRNHRLAIIGGPANKHTSAINGTRMKRKP